MTAQELAALRELLAPIRAAVFIPATGHVYCCPRWPGIHECPSSFDLPTAERFAAYLSETTGTEAYVLVYGVPWAT